MLEDTGTDPDRPDRVRDAPIGVFDSGVGGLTVARAVIDQLPHESIVYIGDTAHGPYGPLALDDVRRHALDVMDHLVEAYRVKMLVIACNTASAACLEEARERYSVPVVEVIGPAVRRAVATTRSGRVGVIGTVATIASGAYQRAFAAVPGVELTAVACPRFVDFVERGITSGRQVLGLAENYLAPLQAAEIDTLVLGCTHYPLLTGVLSLVLGPTTSLVSSAEETGQDAYRLLAQSGLTTPGLAMTEQGFATSPELAPASWPVSRHRFLATGDPEPFARLGRRFLGPEVLEVSSVGLARA